MRAVFLDRDGVINKAYVRDGKPYPPRTLNELEILPGVREALESLRAAQFKTIVATNQPDVNKGLQTQESLLKMHTHLMNQLALDDIEVCLCKDIEKCPCYKPKPGMLQTAAQKWNIDLQNSYMVGDRWRDIGAGKAVGATTILVDYQYEEACRYEPDFRVKSLLEASQLILGS